MTEHNPYAAPESSFDGEDDPPAPDTHGDRVVHFKGQVIVRRGGVLPERCIVCASDRGLVRKTLTASYEQPSPKRSISAALLLSVLATIVVSPWFAFVVIGLCAVRGQPCSTHSVVFYRCSAHRLRPWVLGIMALPFLLIPTLAWLPVELEFRYASIVLTRSDLLAITFVFAVVLSLALAALICKTWRYSLTPIRFRARGNVWLTGFGESHLALLSHRNEKKSPPTS